MEARHAIRLYSAVIISLFVILLIPGVQSGFVSNHILWFYILLFSYIITNITTPAVRFIATCFNIVDKPGARFIPMSRLLWGE